MSEIVKVQVPLAVAGDTNIAAPALVYAQGGKYRATLPITDELLAGMRGRPKNFFNAEIVAGEIASIDWREPAPWQDW